MDSATVYTKFYKSIQAQVKSGNANVVEELRKGLKQIKAARNCGYVYAAFSCLICHICCVKPCLVIAMDENDRYKKFQKVLAKGRRIYWDDWDDDQKMNDLFLKAMDVIDSIILEKEELKDRLYERKRIVLETYESNPTQQLSDEVSNINMQLSNVHSKNNDEFVKQLLKYVMRHHNISTEFLRSQFVVNIDAYDMTVLKAAAPILSFILEDDDAIRMDDIIAMDTSTAYRFITR